MYLLYLDGSGSVKNPTERHFVLAGVAVFERQIYHLISKFDSFVTSLNLGNAQNVELHASVMANGNRSVRAFATVVDKQDQPAPCRIVALWCVNRTHPTQG